MGLRKTTVPTAESQELYKKCFVQGCPRAQQWILKTNWSRHIHTYECHKADRKDSKGPREVCAVCNKSIVARKFFRHAQSKRHTANQRPANSHEPHVIPTVHRPEVKQNTILIPVSQNHEVPGANENENQERQSLGINNEDSADEDAQGLHQNLSINGQGSQSCAGIPAVQTPQQEMFAASEKGLKRSITALEEFVKLPLLSTSETRDLHPERPQKRARRFRKQEEGEQLEAAESRAKVEAAIYLILAKLAENVLPMSAAEYWEKKDDPEAMRRAWVVCTMAEARSILEESTPKVPILVPSEKGKSRAVEDLDSIPEFLDYVLSKSNVEVHRFDTPVNDPHYNSAKRMSSNQAVEMFNDAGALPINFLNLGNTKDNPVPEALAGLRAYKILKEITEDNKLGKPNKASWADLSSCLAFHILAKKGAFSLPHVDHHGVITTITCDDREKLWLIWSQLSDEEKKTWNDNVDTMPAPVGIPFPICLRPGDVLIQPRGCVHAPYSITNVKMSGTMHWDSRDMLGVLNDSLLERDCVNITNEDTAKQFHAKIKQVDKLWREQHPSYPWGRLEEYQKWTKRLEVSFIVPVVAFCILIEVTSRSGELVDTAMEDALEGSFYDSLTKMT